MSNVVPGATLALFLIHLLDRFFAGRALHMELHSTFGDLDRNRLVIWGTRTNGDLHCWEERTGTDQYGWAIYEQRTAQIRYPFILIRVPCVISFREAQCDYGRYSALCAHRLELLWRGAGAPPILQGWRHYWNPVNDPRQIQWTRRNR